MSAEFPPDPPPPHGPPSHDDSVEGVVVEGDRVLFSCATCGKELRTGRERAGRTTACPQCGTPVTVPDTGFAAPAAVRPAGSPAAGANCPMCGADNPPGAALCTVCGERLPGRVGADGPRRRGPRREVGTVRLGETFREGGRLFSEHFGLLLGGMLLFGLLWFLIVCLVGGPFQGVAMAIGGQFPGAGAGQPPRPDAATALAMAAVVQFGQLLGAAAAGFLFAGFVRLRLNLIRRGRAEIQDLFEEKSLWIAAGLCSMIYAALTVLPGSLAWAVATAGDGGMAALGFGGPLTAPGPAGPVTIFDFDPAWLGLFLAVWVVQVVIGVLLWPFLFLCVDYKLGGFAPLAESPGVIRGSFWPLLGLSIVQGLILFAGAVPCGLGLLIAAPYVCALNVAAYQQISGNLEAARAGEEYAAAG